MNCDKYDHCNLSFCICIGFVLYGSVVLGFDEKVPKLTILTKATYNSKTHWEHHAVIRSLKNGLKILNIAYNYNPNSVEEVADIVLVVCNSEALSQAIELKKKNLIKKLFVGPNFYPHEVNYPEVDVYWVPSVWVIRFASYDCPNIVSRCRVWFSGVDEDYWNPCELHDKSSRNVLVYKKTGDSAFCQSVEKVLKRYNWNPIRVTYGGYAIKQYKAILNNCRFAIFISESESQGLALAECWAMNVPTFPWNPGRTVILNHVFDCVSSCPYLREQMGEDWKTIDDLEVILKKVDGLLPTYFPRQWVLNHMTDKVSVSELMLIIDQEMLKF